MTQDSPANMSILVRGAVFAGRMAGTWRHRQRSRAQDAFVALWKDAWVQGCRAAWSGGPSLVPAAMSEPQRAAWTAGWTWAQTQPDRRRAARSGWKVGGRRSTDVPRPLVRAAKGGAAGLVVFATARWLLGTRRSVPKPAEPESVAGVESHPQEPERTRQISGG